MNQITFCIPSKNNLRYLKSSISSILKNSTLDNEIIVWVDASDDRTIEWLLENNIKHLINPNSEPQGIATGYNRCIEVASNDIVCMFHADMFMGKGFDINIIKHLKPKTVISGTRIEPPLHPEGEEKIIKNFGIYPEDFDEDGFDDFVIQIQNEQNNQITSGIFAPWVCYKNEILEIGTHDENYHSYHEDSDIFNRFILNRMELIQSRDALVYHLTCRGGQFQDGIEKITTDGNFHNMKSKAARHYIRKWGSWIKNDKFHHPILSPKYDIGYSIKHCNLDILKLLEPWCSNILIDDEMQVLTTSYIDTEQKNTSIDLNKRIKSTPLESLNNDIIVEFDAHLFTENSFRILQQLPDIIKENGEVGKFELDIFIITINAINEYQNDLITI